MLRKMQADIGFEYIFFHGILTDDLFVYSESRPNGTDIASEYLNSTFIADLLQHGLLKASSILDRVQLDLREVFDKEHNISSLRKKLNVIYYFSTV